MNTGMYLSSWNQILTVSCKYLVRAGNWLTRWVNLSYLVHGTPSILPDASYYWYSQYLTWCTVCCTSAIYRILQHTWCVVLLVLTYSILQWFVGVWNGLPGRVTIAVVVGACGCVILLRPRDVVVPTCGIQKFRLWTLGFKSVVFGLLYNVHKLLYVS